VVLVVREKSLAPVPRLHQFQAAGNQSATITRDIHEPRIAFSPFSHHHLPKKRIAIFISAFREAASWQCPNP